MKKLLILFTFFVWLPMAYANVVEFDRAIQAYDSGNYKTAFPIFKSLAEEGYAEAQNNLGIMYENGRGVLKNYGEALKWYQKAAKGGYVEAQYNLGLLYHKGHGVPKNPDKALKWFQEAALQGKIDAQVNLAVVYVLGDGVIGNYTQAYKWASVALANGDKEMKEFLSLLEENMTPADIEKAQQLAKQCWESKYKKCGR